MSETSEAAQPESILDWRLILGAALLIIAPILGGIFYQTRYEQAAANDVRKNAEYANQKIAEACPGVTDTKLVHCFSDARIKAELEKQAYTYNQADLIAQRKTALWTEIMAWAALVGVSLSVVGVLLVWRTFRATREANEISRQAMMAENRAWLELDPQIQRGDLRFEKEEVRLRVVFKFKNIGKSVARNVRLRADLIKDPFWGEGDWEAAERLSDELARDSGRILTEFVFPGRDTASDHDVGAALDGIAILVGEKRPRLIVPLVLCLSAQYSTIFDGPEARPRQTIMLFSLRRLDDQGRPSLGIIGKKNVPAASLAFVTPAMNLSIVS